MIELIQIRPYSFLLGSAAMLAACGGGGGGSAPPPQYSIGGSVSGLTGSGLVLQNNATDTFTTSSDGTFTFTTTLATGSAYAVTVETQPTASSSAQSQTCSISAGSGAVDGGAVTSIVVVCLNNPARYAYVANSGSSSVSAYSIDSASGAFTPLTGSPFAAGDGPVALTIHPSGNFAYASNSTSHSISAYTIGTGGTLSPLVGSPIVVTTGPFETGLTSALSGYPLSAVVFDPSGQVALVSDGNVYTAPPPTTTLTQTNNFFAFAVNPTTGAMTPVAGSPFSTGGIDPVSVAITASGKFAYVTNTYWQVGAEQSAIAAYAINADAGTVTAVSGSPFVPLGENILPVVLNNSDTILYDVGKDFGTISAYGIDSTSGALSLLANPATNLGTNTVAFSLTPNGSFAYGVVNAGSQNTGGFSINASTGALTGLAGSPLSVGKSPGLVAIDPTNKFLLITDTVDNTVYEYTIDAISGALTAVGGSPFATGTLPSNVTIDPADSFVYVTNQGSNNISVYSVNPTTYALTPVPGSPFASGTAPTQVVLLQ